MSFFFALFKKEIEYWPMIFYRETDSNARGTVTNDDLSIYSLFITSFIFL